MNIFDALAQAIQESLRNELVGTGLILMLSGALLALCRTVPARAFGLLQRQFVTSTEILDHSRAFHWVSVWLDGQAYARVARRVTATVNFHEEPARLMFTPAPGQHWLWYQGRLIWLHRQRRELTSGDPRGKGVAEAFVIRAFERKPKIARALIMDAQQLAEQRNRGMSVFLSRPEGWKSLSEYVPRRMNTVVLPGDLAEDVERDIREFLDAKDWYDARGIPWRRGYLLHGLPGTGKQPSFRRSLESSGLTCTW